MKEVRYYSIANVFKDSGIETVSRDSLFFISNVDCLSLKLVFSFKLRIFTHYYYYNYLLGRIYNTNNLNYMAHEPLHLLFLTDIPFNTLSKTYIYLNCFKCNNLLLF